jgi:hypothetical protein
MKTVNKLILLGSVILAMGIGFTGCKKASPPPPKPTILKGSASFPAGVSGDLSGSKAYVFTTLQEWQNNTPAASADVAGTGDSVTYSIENLAAGTYYLAVWKDVNSDGRMDAGDYLGLHATGSPSSYQMLPIVIEANHTYTIDVQMFVMIPTDQLKN